MPTTTNSSLFDDEETESTTDFLPDLNGKISAQAYWIACLIANTLMLTCQIWIASRFVIHVIRSSNKKSRLSGGIILKSAAVAVIIPMTRFAATLALFIVTLDTENDTGCEIAIDFAKACFVVALFFEFVFFWIRQRAFYRHPCLGHTFGKCAGILSKISIGLSVLLMVIIIPLSVFPAEYEASDRGCVFKNGEKIYSFREYLYTAVIVVSQIILLGLFLHPLWVHHKSQERMIVRLPVINQNDNNITAITVKSNCGAIKNTIRGTQVKIPVRKKDMRSLSAPLNCTSVVGFSNSSPESNERQAARTVSHSTSKKAKKQARLFTLMKRTLALTLTAVMTDLVVMVIVGVILPSNTPQVITRLVYDVDLFINTATVLVSFENWIEILLPLRKSSGEDYSSESTTMDRCSDKSPRPSAIYASVTEKK